MLLYLLCWNAYAELAFIEYLQDKQLTVAMYIYIYIYIHYIYIHYVILDEACTMSV